MIDRRDSLTSSCASDAEVFRTHGADLLHISQQSCYLFGRDRGVVDIPLDHLSCSKQHAVLQFRLIVERNEFGDEKRNIK